MYRWVQLLLASAERAWANAMAMKASQSQESTQKPMPGSTKRQIASRLRRAITYAENLVTVLQESISGKDSTQHVLEARAYLYMMRGTLDFERSRWKSCIQDYSLTQVVYETLGATGRTDLYKDLLSSIIEPSMRYAAYQLKVPRTRPVKDLVVENFPTNELATKESLIRLDAHSFQTTKEVAETQAGAEDIPTHISWRNRKVKLEDANIAQALAIAQEKEKRLEEKFVSGAETDAASSVLANAYEEVITVRQDAADATKEAIDELGAEGVDAGDSRMQSLQITRTAVNYAVIEWRVGRNRVLCGPRDGLHPDTQSRGQSKATPEDSTKTVKSESSGRRLGRLREKTALYDSISQSLESVKELPGVVADQELVSDIESKNSYFRALKCMAIGQSHAINGDTVNALALYSRALNLVKTVSSQKPSDITSTPPRLDVASSQVQAATSQLSRLVTQYRALAELKALSASSASKAQESVYKRPLIETFNLNQYSDDGDLKNLVNYPPKLRPIPVKPLFFDLAWNYIQYPGREKRADADPAPTSNGSLEGENGTREEPRRRGWFGFGRS